MIIPSDITVGNFPLNYSATPTEFFNDYRARLRLSLPDDRVLVGIVSATNPGYDAGPWLQINGSNPWVLYYWDKARGGYYQTQNQLGTGTYKISFQIGGTAGPNDAAPGFILPDKDGTAATTLDLYAPRATYVEVRTATTLNFNGSLYDNVFHRLTRNTAYNLITLSEAQSMNFTVENNGTAYTLSWLNVLWPAGTAPVQPVATAGQTAVGSYTITRINSLLFGEYVATYSSLPVTVVDEGGPDNNLDYNPSGHVGPGPGQILP